jgi:hypothetical protein
VRPFPSTKSLACAAALVACGSSSSPPPGSGSAASATTAASTGVGGANTGSSTGGPTGSSAGGSSGATSGAGGSTGGSFAEAGTPEAAPRDAAGADASDASSIGLPVPGRDEYLKTLYELDDLLLSTQINRAGDPNDGALVSPSTNPTPNPIHSRAAEAIYPFAVAFKYGNDTKYADAAVRLGNWLIGIQNAGGWWIEEWPATTGWDGTSADQLISLAGAYAILKPRLSAPDGPKWIAAITKCADWIVTNFPKSNINYSPTGAVALVFASKAVPSPNASWLTKAASLMDSTLQSVNQDGLLTGEGMGVDLGYNIAQSIGMIAMYGKLLPSPMHVDSAAALLKTHERFMYPNGAIDNSWGTRNFKWMFESGTKTAPGIIFSFALVADKDPSFQRGAQLALAYLRSARDDKGWIAYGPHAAGHSSSNPPDNYSTFARAQSLATAIEYGPAPGPVGQIPADTKNWLQFFPSVETGVFRTDKIMATITSYGAIGTYPRESMARGGSVSALWFEGYGPTGFLQVSSQTVYSRIEPLHMPIEATLLPLTPRVETVSGTYYANILDDQAMLTMSTSPDGVQATASGVLRSVAGAASPTTFRWSYTFGAASYTKELTVSAASGLRIVEPFVDNPGTTFELKGTDTFQISPPGGHVWQLQVVSSTGSYQLVAGENQSQYWIPFPGVDGYPLSIVLGGAGSATIKYTVTEIQ